MVGLSSEAGISKRAMHTFHYDTFCVEGSVSSRGRGRGGSTILDFNLTPSSLRPQYVERTLIRTLIRTGAAGRDRVTRPPVLIILLILPTTGLQVPGCR